MLHFLFHNLRYRINIYEIIIEMYRFTFKTMNFIQTFFLTIGR